MRALCLFLVCLASVSRPTLSAEADAAAEATGSTAAVVAAERKDSGAAAAVDELLEVSETSNNNTASADDKANNSKRTIDHNLGYGYRYNTVLRPVLPPHHYLAQQGLAQGLPQHMMARRPAYKLVQSVPRFQHGAHGAHGNGHSLHAAPFRSSQPLPSPTHQQPRPVTETPSGPHSEHAAHAAHAEQDAMHVTSGAQSFAYEDEVALGLSSLGSLKPEQQQQQQQQQQVEQVEQTESEDNHGVHHGQGAVQYAEEAPQGPQAQSSAPHSYQQVLQQLQQQVEPTYILAGTPPSAVHSSHAAHAAHAAHSTQVAQPTMYAASQQGLHAAPLASPLTMYTGGALSGALGGASHMIPVIIVRLMDSQASHSHHMPMHVPVHVPYPLINMHFLRDYLSKMYAPSLAPSGPGVAASVPAPQYADTAAALMYPSSLLSATQLQKLQLQQQLHAQLQTQLQYQQQQQQQQRILQEQQRSRHSGGPRTEVTVHRSTAMSPQDYKESVEQQEDA